MRTRIAHGAPGGHHRLNFQPEISGIPMDSPTVTSHDPVNESHHEAASTHDVATPPPLASTSLAQHTAALPSARQRAGMEESSGTLRLRRGPAPENADLEAARPAREQRLRRLALAHPGTTDAHINIASTTAHVLYGKKADHVPDDVLHSLLERAPLYERHGVVTEKALRSFLQKSRAEMMAPLIGRSGYLVALSVVGTYLGKHIPSPATGLPIGASVMFTTTNTSGARDGLEGHYIPQLVTSGLPASVQRRYDRYAREALPEGVRAESERQVVRALVTLVPALHAMRTGQPMDQARVVLNDVYADAFTFFGAESLDDGLQALGKAVKDVAGKMKQSGDRLREQGIEAPTHGELIAHQPLDQLERRLVNHNKGLLESGVDAARAMGKGISTLWTERFGRLLGVPAHAGFIIATALVLTSHLIEEDPKNAALPEGKITPRSALAVPGALMIMEFFATEAFGTLLGICDSLLSRTPRPIREEEDPVGRIEVVEDESDHERGEELSNLTPPRMSGALPAAESSPPLAEASRQPTPRESPQHSPTGETA